MIYSIKKLPSSLRTKWLYFLHKPLKKIKRKKIGFGTWPQHIESWLHASEKYSGIFLRYEDLRQNCQEFRKII